MHSRELAQRRRGARREQQARSQRRGAVPPDGRVGRRAPAGGDPGAILGAVAREARGGASMSGIDVYRLGDAAAVG